MVDSSWWKRAFSTIRADFQLPTRDAIANSLLEKVYEDTATTARQLVAAAPSVALLCDGWSNVRYAIVYCIFFIFVVC
jgi:hypothetical protein